MEGLTAAELHSMDAGQVAKKLTTEGLRKPAQDNPRKGPEAKIALASAEVPRRPPKKCRFAKTLA
jgi:hypothetical protein